MGKLNSAIKRIENKGKQPVNPKKNEMAEVAPVVGAVAKGVATVGKAVVKGVGAATKAAKAGVKVAKGSSKVASTVTKNVTKTASNKPPVARKLTKRRNVKNPRYRKLEKDDKGNIVRGKEFDRKLYDQDGNQKTQGYMSAMDGPDKSVSFDREMRQKQKEKDAEKKGKEERDKKVADTAQRLKKGTGTVVKKTGQVIKKTGELARGGVSNVSGAFGKSSFKTEGITFKEYLNKL